MRIAMKWLESRFDKWMEGKSPAELKTWRTVFVILMIVILVLWAELPIVLFVMNAK